MRLSTFCGLHRDAEQFSNSNPFYSVASPIHSDQKVAYKSTVLFLLFFLYIFRGFLSVFWVPLPPLRGQYTVLCHPRWLPTSGLTELAVCCGGAGFIPRTTDLQSGALPLSHLSSAIEPPLLQTIEPHSSNHWATSPVHFDQLLMDPLCRVVSQVHTSVQ